MKVKIHKAYRYIVAICDSDLLGKKFEEGKFQLDLTGSFFDGDEKSEEEVREIIEDMRKEDACFNIIGREAVNLAREMEIANETTKIQGVPIALVLM